jgi:hypothetical protein
VAIAAVIFSLVPGGSAPPPAVPRALPATAEKEMRDLGDTVESGPLRILYDYLDMRSGGTATTSRPLGEMRKDCAEADLHPVSFLIATVPDPIDSHLATSFDRALDAIQDGMQDKGYVLDRFSLPWKRDAATRWNIARPDPGSPVAALVMNATSTPSDAHRRSPGALLFREAQASGPDAAERLVLVLLVGETPTSGVQREALTSALDAITACPKKDLPCVKSCASSEIAILGPYFSGSTDSLRHLLVAWTRGNATPIRIVSGSATVNSNLRELTFGQVRFQATVVPDNALTQALFDFFQKRLRVEPTGSVAIFAETGTTYGASDLHTWVPFVIKFPLHVSQLRGAYEKDDALRSSAPASRAPRHALELALETPEGSTRDILPAQDAGMAANIADLALSNGVEMIRREGIRFVGIVASDPRDVLFVARKIRENAANVTLFTYGADVLYTHPDYAQYLRGMLVVTPYPLFPANQDWTGFLATRKAFPGSSEEGIYNAVQALVRDTDQRTHLLEYRSPLHAEGRDVSLRPPIWITAVGRGGFWPVDIQASYAEGSGGNQYVLEDPAPPSATKGPTQYRPAGGTLAFVLIELLLGGMVLVTFVMRRRDASPAVRGPEPPGQPAPRPPRRSTFPQGLVQRAETVLSVWSATSARQVNRAYVAVLLLLLAFVQATLVVVVWQITGFFGAMARVALFAPALLILVCLVTLAVREVIFLLRKTNGEGKATARQQVLAPAIFLAVLGVLLFRCWREILSMDAVERLSFYARALDLTSTISPILPFLLSLTVLVLWAASNIQRAFLLEVQGKEYPSARTQKTFAGVQELQGAIQNLLADPATRATLLLVPVVVFVPFYRVVLQPYDTIDGQAWSVLFKFCLLSCYFAIVYGVTLFIALWLRVRLLLQRLSWHPVAEAFKRLPESVAASPWRMWRAVPNFTGLETSVAQLWTLVNLGKGSLAADYWATLKARAEEAQAHLDKAFDEASRSFVQSLPTQRELRRCLSDAMVHLLQPLEEVWRRWPGPADAQKELRRAGAQEQFFSVPDWLRRDIPGGSAIWIRAAEEFVALRLSSYVRYVFLQIKNLLTFAFLEFLIVIAAINSYPFQPKHPVMALVWVVAVICVGLVAWSFIGMERDRVLSYIGKTKPGEVMLSFEFISSMTIYVIVPLLTLLATQFPGVGDAIFSAFAPAMKSLR